MTALWPFLFHGQGEKGKRNLLHGCPTSHPKPVSLVWLSCSLAGGQCRGLGGQQCRAGAGNTCRSCSLRHVSSWASGSHLQCRGLNASWLHNRQPAPPTSWPPPALGTDSPVQARCPSHVSSTGQPPLFKGLGLSHLSSGRPHLCALVPLPSSSPSLLNEHSRQLLPRPPPLQCLLPREPPGPPPGLLQPHIPFGKVTTSSWEKALGKACSLHGPKSLHQ